MITVAIPVLNQFHHANNAIESFKSNQVHENYYYIMDNGSTTPFKHKQINTINHYKENKGLPFVMNEVLKEERKLGERGYVLFTHSDVLMHEHRWDEITEQAIKEAGNVGVAGYYGALGMGSVEIYKQPYAMHQLARQRPIAGVKCELDARVHGQTQFSELFHPCVVLDGFALIVKVDSDLWFWNESIHHNYDQDICLESIDRGYQNIVINLAVDHLGGQTDVNEDWVKGTNKSKSDIHAESHIPLYEKWKPGNRRITLPYWA